MQTDERSRFNSSYLPKLLSIYLLLVLVEVVLILRLGHGRFSYSLDDPYIHLALAQRILHGLYGLNSGEVVSPASSILWPFLLAPISAVPFRAWSPLLLNLLSGCGACFLINKLLLRWNVLQFKPQFWQEAARWLLALLLVVAGNFVGLTIVGMEHLLQVLLMIGCTYGILEAYADRPIPIWALVMAALAPSVRYEDLAFTLAVVIACMQQRRIRAGALTLLAALVPLVAFGLFLHAHGLPPLPISVLVKGSGAAHTSNGTSVGQTSVLKNALASAKSSFLDYLHLAYRWDILFGTAVLLSLAIARFRNRAERNTLLCAVLAATLMILLAPYGWMMRYEVALRMFVLLMLLIAFAQQLQYRVVAVLLLAAIFANSYRASFKQNLLGAQTIVREQYWMHFFEERYYKGPVAVNDLGWVSFDHDPKVYVLDLGGLGSRETAFSAAKDAAFLDRVTKEHGIGLAMIYHVWFPDTPKSWVFLGTLWQPPTRQGYLGNTFVSFFATKPEDAPMLREELKSFKANLPNDVYLDLEPADGATTPSR